MTQPQQVVRFGTFEFNLRSGELRKGGLRIRLSGQPARILTLLLEQPGEVVTRESLRKELWADNTFVDFEHRLNSSVKRLREALNDSADQPRYIETVPRLGYRFIAPVAAAAAPAAAQDEASSVEPGCFGPAAAQAPARSRRFRRVLLATAAVLAAAAIGLTFKRPQAAPFSQIKVTRLTSGGQSFKAAISPDGRYIAHTVLEAGRESLLVRRSNTVHDVEIGPPGPVRYVGITFAPDSETIYYAVNQAGQPAALSRIPVMGGAAERIKDSLDSPISFSPDGKKYAFVRESAGRSALLEADLASGAERTLVVHELPAALDYPAWSPDGRVIAYTMYDAVTSSRAGSGARVMEVRVADGSERQISNQTLGFIRELAWLGDGSGLVMSARAGDPGFFHLWYVSYPDGVTRKITDGLNYQTGVAVSASAPRQLVTVEQSLFSSLWRLRTFAGDAERVTPGVSGTSAPAWTPDGRIVFEEELNGQRSLWVVDSGGTNRTQLTVAGNSYSPSVSKDGRRIAFMSDRSGSPAIWTMNIDGGNPALVLKAGGDTTPQFSPDGRWIVFTAVGSRHWNTLWRIAASGGKPAELNEDLWFAPAVSPDGEWVAGFYSKGALSTQSKPFLIAVVGIGGGEPHTKIPIPPSVVAGAGLRWSPDSRELIYVDSGQDGANLWSRPWTGGPPRQLTHFRGATLFSFDLSRDGQQIAFNQGRQARDVILIEDAAR